MSRILGIDYGTRRIGVAFADSKSRIASPLTTVDACGDVTRDAKSVIGVGERESAEAYVVGLPLNMGQGESQQTALTRRFAAELARLSGKAVHLQDERLTTFAADEVLDQSDLRRRKKKDLRDRIAAQKILQAYLDLPGQPGP